MRRSINHSVQEQLAVVKVECEVLFKLFTSILSFGADTMAKGSFWFVSYCHHGQINRGLGEAIPLAPLTL